MLTLSAGLMVGCRNRVAEERDALWAQSRQQQEELDKRNAELEAMRRAQSERPTAVAPTPPPAPTPTAVAPPPPPPPPAPTPEPVKQIAGLQTESNINEGTVTVTLPGDIFFNSGAATIMTPAKSSLDKVATALKKDYAGKQVRIEGHTDSDPIRKSKWKNNQELSEARAKSVRDYLVSKGVPANLIDTKGYGADKPRGQDKSRNRRVEVVVLVDPAAAKAAAAHHKAPALKVDKPEVNK
jgi:flagellar motor protein MotB